MVKIPTDAPVLGNQIIVGDKDGDDSLSDFPSSSPLVAAATTRPTSTSLEIEGEVAEGEGRDVEVTSTPSSVPVSATSGDVNFCDNITNDQRTADILNGVSLSMADSALVIKNRMPFQQAFQWLIDDDLYRVCPGDPNLEQRFTLGAVYFSLSGWNESAIDFLSQEDECDWGGIKCSAEGAVESMRLDDFNLTGVLPDLSLMSASLKELDLDSNKLSGEFPAWVTKLTQLEILDLDTNALSGTIPRDMSALTALRVLDLDANSIEGTIPESIGDLDSLYFFQVDFNLLTGVIPSRMAALSNLEYLSVFGNDFTEPLSIDFCSRNRTLSLFANCEICTIAECCTACLNV